MTLKQTKKREHGFTIVELLIVVVIIAILAAITIVAYNGIQNRAKTSAAQSQANAIAKKFEALNAVKGSYYSSATGVTGANLNTYASTDPKSTEANLDYPATLIAATSATAPGLTAATALTGSTAVVSSWACAGGANIWYWDFTQGNTVMVKAGAGC